MAPWIAHLRLAENLLADIPGLDQEAFSVGSVAPDSGVPDERHEHFTPPPAVTHFHTPEGASFPIADLAFYREHLRPALAGKADSRRASFLLGYYFHLLADILWFRQIGEPTQARFKPQFDANPDFIWEVKRDWYGLDLAFVRANPDCLYWKVFLGATCPQDYLPYLPASAIAERVQEIKDLYRRTDDEIEAWYGDRPGVYLSQAEYDSFVDGNRRRLSQAYTTLTTANPSTEGHASVFELGL